MLNEVALHFVEPREIKISQQQAKLIGQKILQNETGGIYDNLIVWNEGEGFPSLGIGHFIWYPQGVEHSFVETFPAFKEYLKKQNSLPKWLELMKYSPWRSREQFLKEKYSDLNFRLKNFLQSTADYQIQFIVSRLENSLAEMLKTIRNPFARKKVQDNFYHVSMQPNGVYALVDYVNFKGEGISPKERYHHKGWGLLQVLQQMTGKDEDVMADFVRAADLVLHQRVENAPRDESKWLPGWQRRLQSYCTSSCL